MIGPTGFERCGGLDYDQSTDTLYATCERNDGSNTGVLIEVDPATGQGTEVGPFMECNSSTDISLRHADNALFGALFSGCSGFGLALINKNTGNVDYLGDLEPDNGCCGNGMAFPLTDTLFLVDDTSLYTVNQSNGSLTTVTNVFYPGSLVNFPRINAIDLNTSTGDMFVIIVDGGSEYDAPRTNYLGVINLNTGVVTLIGQTQGSMDGLAVVKAVFASPVPTLSESGFILMAVILLAGALIVLRRRQKAVQS